MHLESFVLLGIVAVGMSTGCTSGRNVELKPDAFVGDYIWRSADKGAPHDPDKLFLGADGRYVVVHIPGGHQGSAEEGSWKLVNKPTPNILLGHAGYPIRIDGKAVRLLINDDLGWSYEKTQ